MNPGSRSGLGARATASWPHRLAKGYIGNGPTRSGHKNSTAAPTGGTMGYRNGPPVWARSRARTDASKPDGLVVDRSHRMTAGGNVRRTPPQAPVAVEARRQHKTDHGCRDARDGLPSPLEPSSTSGPFHGRSFAPSLSTDLPVAAVLPTAMDGPLIYAITLAAVVGTLCFGRAASLLWLRSTTCRRGVGWVRKAILYKTLFRRPRGAHDVTLVRAVCLALFIAANVLGLVWRRGSSADLASRASRLFLFNLPLLFVGEHPNWMIDRGLRLPLPAVQLTHRWAGRCCLAFGALHGGLQIAGRRSAGPVEILVSPSLLSLHPPFSLSLCASILALRATSLIGSLTLTLKLASTLLVVLLSSFLPLRRWAPSLFARTHTATSLCLLVGLWLHIPRRVTLDVGLIAAASGLWLLGQICWVADVLRRNGGLSGCIVHDVELRQGIVRVRLRPRTAFDVFGGQHLFAIAYDLRHLSRAQPMMIAWAGLDDAGDGRRGPIIDLLADGRSDFADILRDRDRRRHGRPGKAGSGHDRLCISGPYGGQTDVGRDDKVLYVADGIGVAAHLWSVHELLTAHNDVRAKVRRISLCWRNDNEGMLRGGPVRRGGDRGDRGRGVAMLTEVLARSMGGHPALPSHAAPGRLAVDPEHHGRSHLGSRRRPAAPAAGSSRRAAVSPGVGHQWPARERADRRGGRSFRRG